MLNFILQFNFETGDVSCKYYQVYVVVKNQGRPDFEALEDAIVSYFESSAHDEGSAYENNVNDIMCESGLAWNFMREGVPQSELIHSLWI